MRKLTLLLLSLAALCLTAADIDTLVREGVDNYKRQNFKTAYDRFKAAMRINPNHTEASHWYWKMKKEHDTSNLKDSGLPPTTDATNRGTSGDTGRTNTQAGTGTGDRTGSKTGDGTGNRTGDSGKNVPDRGNQPAADGTRFNYLEQRIQGLQGLLLDMMRQRMQDAPGKDASQPVQTRPDLPQEKSGIDPLLLGILLAIAGLLLLLLVMILLGIRRRRSRVQEYYRPQEPPLQLLPAGQQRMLLPHAPTVEGGAATGEYAALSQEEEVPARLVSFANGFVYLLDKRYQRGENTWLVQSLANEFGIRLAMEREELTELRLLAVLRDAGFLMIPEAIILKKGTLDKEETMEVIRHPHHTAGMLSAMELPDRLVEAARAHHERYDGSGYPDGLAGEAIPLSARIVGLCESYAALTLDRPHKKRIPPGEALDVLETDQALYDRKLLKILSGIVKAQMHGKRK